GVLDEVMDLDDVRMVDGDQEPALGHGRGDRVRVAGVDQALEHDPAVRAGVADVAVPGQVDPAQAAVGQRAEDLVPVVDRLAGLQPRHEGVPGAALRAEALGATGPAVAAAPGRFAAVATEALRLRYLRVLLHGAGRVAQRDRRYLDEVGAQPAPAGAAAARLGTGAGPAGQARPARRGEPRGGYRRLAHRRAYRRRGGRRSGGEQAGRCLGAALVAVPVLVVLAGAAGAPAGEVSHRCLLPGRCAAGWPAPAGRRPPPGSPRAGRTAP